MLRPATQQQNPLDLVTDERPSFVARVNRKGRTNVHHEHREPVRFVEPHHSLEFYCRPDVLVSPFDHAFIRQHLRL